MFLSQQEERDDRLNDADSDENVTVWQTLSVIWIHSYG